MFKQLAGKLARANLCTAPPLHLDPLDYANWWFRGNGAHLMQGTYLARQVYEIICIKLAVHVDV